MKRDVWRIEQNKYKLKTLLLAKNVLQEWHAYVRTMVQFRAYGGNVLFIWSLYLLKLLKAGHKKIYDHNNRTHSSIGIFNIEVAIKAWKEMCEE